MEKLAKWARRKAQKAQEVIGLIDGDRPGFDYLWEETFGGGVVPVTLFMRLPLPGDWNSREVLTVARELLQHLGGACEVQGDKEAATMFYTFITVIEIALDKDEEGRK